MSIPAAFLGVILIWSTTPLAIKWSGEGVGFLFGLTLRMVIGLLLAYLIMFLFKCRFPWHKTARYTYAVAATGLFCGMLLVYYSAQYLSSGLVALIFGLTPIFTGIFASFFLKERAFSLDRLLGIVMGFTGLLLALIGDTQWQMGLWLAILAALASSMIQSAASVWVKAIGDEELSPLATVAGTLTLMMPLFALVWTVSEQSWPKQYPLQSLLSISYLGAFGSLLGFSLYFYVLKHLEASRVALITIVTPILAMLLGAWLNDEKIGILLWCGAGLTVMGLSIYQYGGFVRRLKF